MASNTGASHISGEQPQATDLASLQTSTHQQRVTDPPRNAPASSSRSTKRSDKMQRTSSRLDPATAASTHLTRTGRISKAKKGVKGAHICDCGKTYSRAEHLRRHQQNHSETLYCNYQGCDKIFHREDLLRRHERQHATGDAMDSSTSRSPSLAYTTAAGIDSILSTTPAYSPAPHTPATGTSQPPTPYQAAMSAPRYTVSQFNQFRKPSQPNVLGPFFSPDAKTKMIPTTGLGLTLPPALAIPSLGATDHAQNASQEGVHSASSTFSTTSFEPVWPAYTNAYQSPIVTTNEPWSRASAIHGTMISPVSAVETQQPYWYHPEKTFETSMALSYPMELGTMVPTASDSVSPYLPYVATSTEWDHSMTSMPIKPELSSPISLMDAQPLETTLSLHAKQSYYAAYWEYMHPLYPILHKPTMEQQRHLDHQQSSSDLLLKAAIMICGAVYTKEESRWVDGRILLKKALQHLDQEHLSINHDLKVMQAVFLLEAYAQFHGQRAPAHLSQYFNSIVNQLQHDTDVHGVAVQSTRLASPVNDQQLTEEWRKWIIVHSKHRLLLTCNLLMTQTALYLTHDSNIPRLPWQDLAMPSTTSLWDASTATEWLSFLKSEADAFTINDTINLLKNVQLHAFDQFQSVVLTTAYVSSHPGELAPANIAQLAIQQKLEVQLHIHASLLSQTLPLRALLAVAGESWTPAGGRLATHARVAADLHGHMKNSLRSWVNHAFSPLRNTSAPTSRRASISQDPTTDNATHRAVMHSLTILRLAAQLEEQRRALPFIGEILIYIASLVLWAVGHEAMRRSNNPHYGTMTPPASGSSDFTSAGARQGLVAFINAAETGLLDRICTGLDINAALQWRQGVDATMRWTRLRVGGFTPVVPSNVGGLAPESSGAAAVRPRSQSMPQIQSQPQQQAHFPQQAQLGELNAGVINVLRRLETRGWAGLWF